uniref:Small ribosomal subunit protein uS7m n=1 Tax=Strongyloides venezuelensis TaxID=75913 RepID=A0A0K0FZZ2_STRVS
MANYLKFLSKSVSSLAHCRNFSKFTQTLHNVYDPRIFIEPTLDYEELQKPIAEDDERKHYHAKAMGFDQTPVFYRNHTIDKLVRVFMKDGKKDVVRTHVLEAIEIVKRRQYKAWIKASDKEKETIELNPFVIAEKAINNCRPLLKLVPITRGGITYQVPSPISEDEAEFRAMKMMRDVCRIKAKRGNSDLPNMLASELLGAFKNEGLTIQAKQDFHKVCEANKAYVQYRG